MNVPHSYVRNTEERKQDKQCKTLLVLFSLFIVIICSLLGLVISSVYFDN